jgi:hypothetical protein
MENNDVQPAILTCGAPSNAEAFSRFVASWRRDVVGISPLSEAIHPYRNPVVVLDTTLHQELDGQYLQNLAALWPERVEVHQRCQVIDDSLYESIQHAAHRTLWLGLEQAEKVGAGYVLFIEDDVIFSSQFQAQLAGMRFPPNMGMLTPYLPGTGHPMTGKTTREVDIDCFYGTQAILFPVTALRYLRNTEPTWTREFSPGYDIRWSRAMRNLGFTVHQTEKSYVQHIGRASRLHSDDRFHESGVFVA